MENDPIILKRCIANGAPVNPPANIEAVEWADLFQLDGAACSSGETLADVEDMALFYANFQVQQLKVVVKDLGKDSNFLTLAMETATMLETSAFDTMLSQRRVTTER